MEKITEETNKQEKWYKEAKSPEMTLVRLPGFLKRLTENYSHDYGTVCHALAAGALATLWAMNRTPQCGITGFQASCIMWEIIEKWGGVNLPAKLLQYENMLYPQYAYKFEKTIPLSVWVILQNKAKENLEDKDIGVPRIRKHWQSIVDGVIPFGYTISEDS